jgi:hypothetical protein
VCLLFLNANLYITNIAFQTIQLYIKGRSRARCEEYVFILIHWSFVSVFFCVNTHPHIYIYIYTHTNIQTYTHKHTDVVYYDEYSFSIVCASDFWQGISVVDLVDNVGLHPGRWKKMEEGYIEL